MPTHRPTKSSRRHYGEGSIGQYKTRSGVRFLASYLAVDANGATRRVMKRGFPTKREAASYLRSELRKVEQGEWVDTNKQRLDEYLGEWLPAQRLSPSTAASYGKNIRLHINPYLGSSRVDRLTGLAVDAWMRKLEAHGRADGRGGLSPRTVRYVFTILRSALSDAVKHGRLTVNPTDRSTPPSPSQARPPEMQAWTAKELSRFLDWAESWDSEAAVAYRLLAATGMRRGEALALRWRDVDLDAGRISIRRSVGLVKRAGAGEELIEGPPKTGRARVVDVDEVTVSQLRRHRETRSRLSRDLVADAGIVLGRLDGAHRHPERFSRQFVLHLARARKAVGETTLPRIRLHDLRHTHATLLLAGGVPVKVVSERLGHANANITLGVYAHVHPGMGREAAALFAQLVDEPDDPDDPP